MNWFRRTINRIKNFLNEPVMYSGAPAARQQESRSISYNMQEVQFLNEPVYYTTYYKGKEYTFKFRFKNMGTATGWHAYILSTPSYGTRPDSSSDAHWLSDSDGRYICWSTKIDTLEDMKKVAEVWSNATVMYIANGESLNSVAPRVIASLTRS